MAPKQSIFRQPGAQHFQLVHRSQRDPLIHDPEASQRVLKAFERENTKKGKSRADLERTLSPSDLAHDLERPNIGEAAVYGVYFDDTEYDYMQHLKPTGVDEEGVESFLIEAPQTSKGKGKAREPIALRDLDLPAEALPSSVELPRNYESQEAIPSSIAGFHPDMDPHLRQVLEALEDDAFVDEGVEDDFFGELVQAGERDDDEEFEFDFDEDGIPDGETPSRRQTTGEGEDDENAGWEAQFAKFKREQRTAPVDDGQSDDGFSDGGDTIGRLPEISVIGGKRRRKGTSQVSAYSMSSASLYRSEGLQTLDDRFDQIEKDYAEDDEDEDGPQESEDTDDEAPELVTSREDFESMLNEFLGDYEILGGKMKPRLEGDTGAEKLDTLRRAMGVDSRVRVAESDEENGDDKILMPVDIDERKDRWDCESILSTYSNLENHPRIIRARNQKAVPRIRLDPRTGLPTVVETADKHKVTSKDPVSDTDTDEEDQKPSRATVARPRDESKEDKKARKQAAKDERQTRRAEKKATTVKFQSEIKQQAKSLAAKEASRMKKL